MFAGILPAPLNLTGIMAEEITLSSSHMTDADLTAIAAYLKDQPGQTASPPAAVSASDPKMVAGSAIYADECSACHGLDGKGVPYLFPSLAGSPVGDGQSETASRRRSPCTWQISTPS